MFRIRSTHAVSSRLLRFVHTCVMFHWGGARNVASFSPQHTSRRRTAKQRIRYERTLETILRRPTTFFAITALLLFTITVISYIETRYEFIKVGHYVSLCSIVLFMIWYLVEKVNF